MRLQRLQHVEDPARPGAQNLQVVTLTGDAAACALATDIVVDINGNQLFPAQPSGTRSMLEVLRKEFSLHEHDQATISFDDVLFLFERGKMILIQGAHELKTVLDEVEEKAGLDVNNAGRSHFLFNRPSVPEKLTDGLRLKVDGDMARYAGLMALIKRIAKRQQAGAHDASGGHYTEFKGWTLSEDGCTWLCSGEPAEPAGEYHGASAVALGGDGWYQEYRNGTWQDVVTEEYELVDVLYGSQGRGKGIPFSPSRRMFRCLAGY